MTTEQLAVKLLAQIGGDDSDRAIEAVPESVDGLVSVFCYDEVLTFTFCDEAAADRFAGRFDPSVDSAEAPEHKAVLLCAAAVGAKMKGGA